MCAVCLVSAVLGGCAAGGSGGRRYAGTTDGNDADRAAVVSDITAEATAWADSVLATMSLEQRVGQLFMPAVYARADAATLRKVADWAVDSHVGGIILLRGTAPEAARMALLLDSVSAVPPFMAIDAEWGLGMRLSDAPSFPANGRIGEGVDEEAMYEYGAEVARQCRLVGINMVLGPVLDVADTSGGSVMGVRSFGADAARVASLGVAYARGLEDGDVLSVAKHFPGLGSPDGDSHFRAVSVERSLHELDSVDLVPFRRYIGSGLSCVMVGHTAVPAIDPVRRPAAVSPPVMRDLLRDDMSFRGLVLTDALNMAGAKGYTALDALEAGADIVLAPLAVAPEISGVIDALKRGDLDPALIDDRCRRVLFYKYLTSAPSPGILSDVNTERAAELGRRLTRKQVSK